MEDQKNQNQPIPFKKASSWKKVLGKKWAFPAIYIGTAAIILAFVMWYQGSVMDTVSKVANVGDNVAVTTPATPETPKQNDEAVPVTSGVQPLAWPVGKNVQYEMGMSYYDEQASKDEQQKALVKYSNSFYPHTGIDLKATDGKSFDVVAALAGKVVKVENDPLVGKTVEVEHADKMVTVYQSLENTTVKPGDEVTQGQVIGSAGRNEFEKDFGVHLHFEVRVDDKPVNPQQYLIQAEAKNQ
ncbi:MULTISPECIES: M23 family metallopeptidase [Brevibacillus]|uniref:Stage II sporulation protein Q n=1 Tax=Brevibacillus parabrevis TaxID=54914 RepID=A0A4Y3PD83_BREPA|nr:MULTISPECIES: M23 family metallopeptidase [Brevibacillus]TGV29876.1 M23 family metallopeptidase [Mesorhizobium sp. M00.F.Ca.ET.186.01.1.1]KZE49497.1 peptidase M23 [Brevibacillus parabrevis]MBU8713619.1 M23 family metallopeptidase [Brevibacillus parabrevis]MDR4997821.1 M23 family metallopeptidase [Brevibacillus parabrevis]MED1722459.1 M23 family metallopeptidase [Brevibacillus parabrevis]